MQLKPTLAARAARSDVWPIPATHGKIAQLKAGRNVSDTETSLGKDGAVQVHDALLRTGLERT